MKAAPEEYQVDPAQEQIAIALADPHSGFSIARRLSAIGESHRASQILTKLMEEPTRLFDLGSLQYWKLAFREMQRLVATLLPHVGKMLKNTDNRARLVANALDTLLGQLQSFLAYVEGTEELKPVFRTLAEALSEPANRARLVANALDTPLDELQSFLAYVKKPRDPTKTPDLTPVFKTLAEALRDPANRARLVEKGLDTPLGQLQFFLAYVKKPSKDPTKTPDLAPVFKTLAEALKDPANRASLVENALDTPLNDLQSFLAYAEGTEELKPVFNTLVLELNKPDNRQRLSKRFTEAPLDQLVNILRTPTARDLWKAVITDVDGEEWMASRLRYQTDKIDAFVAFKRLVTAYERPELSAAPALNLVRRADSRPWHQPVIGLHHFSHALRCAKDASPTEIARFLERIATPAWVDALYGKVSAGGLAGNILALARVLPPEVSKPFLRGSLRKRVIREITASALGKLVARTEALSLLGAAALLGVRIDSVIATWPSNEELAAILESRKPDPESSSFHLQIQLWKGLREMARLKNEPVNVPAEYGDEILKLWLATRDGEQGQSLPSHIRQANEEMIRWLNASKAAGWTLAKDEAISVLPTLAKEWLEDAKGGTASADPPRH